MKKPRKKRKKANWLLYGFAAFLILFAFIWVYNSSFQNSNSVHNAEGGNVAIVDQLCTTHPNITFWSTVQSLFNEEGLKTYYYGSVTVGFYRGLPSRGFSIIILRAHSAVWLETGKLVLLTNEKWSESKASTTYLADILADRLAVGAIDSLEYFAIYPDFVRAMNGNFNDTLIIMMGCETLMSHSMADAFVQKGAKVCIGWTGPISIKHADNSIIYLLKHLITEKESVSEAVAKTMEEVGEDPDWGGRLDWYPYEEGDLTLTTTGKLTFKNGWINIRAASDLSASGSNIRRKYTHFKIQHCQKRRVI